MSLPVSQGQYDILLLLSSHGKMSRQALWLSFTSITSKAKRKAFNAQLNHLVALRKVDRLRLSGGRIVYRINPSAV